MGSKQVITSMDNIEEYYDTLGIKSGASLDEIKQAYQDSIKVWHLGRFTHEDEQLRNNAEERTKEIDLAYALVYNHYFASQQSTESGTPS